jgi:SAM-dependent methyltransferase
MDWNGIDIICPNCRGELQRVAEERGDATGRLVCLGCSRSFPVVCGIPDLRVFPDPYITLEEEYAKARHLVSRYRDFDFAGLVEYYYSISPLVPPHHAKKYARGLLAAASRTELWLAGWESVAAGLPRQGSEAPAARNSFLDLGCGTAPLLIAAKNYPRRVGVDLALRWLVMARKRLMEAALDLPLVCACAEALPFRDGEFVTVAADSVLEHLRDQPRGLAEAHRVTQFGGRLFLATPNRFSIGPDPQTGIWGGSLLPLSWTQAIVRRQGGLPPQRQLLSAGKLRRLLGQAGYCDPLIYLPGVPADRTHFPFAVRAGMAAYEAARLLPVAGHLLRLVGPIFHSVAQKL